MLPDSLLNKELTLENSLLITEELIIEFEQEFECKLPSLFISFLKEYASKSLNATIKLLEPNPLANWACPEMIFGFFEDREDLYDIRDNTQLADGWPAAIPFAADGFDNWFYLFLGQNNSLDEVYFYDIQNRASWTDDQFDTNFPNLHPEINQYLQMRARGELPQKEDKFQHFYLVSNSFSGFLKNLRPIDKKL